MKILALILMIITLAISILVGQARLTSETEVTTSSKSVTIDGMQADWYFQEDHVVFEVLAPTEGWVVLGFNQRDDIIDANLIMGAVIDDKLVIEDQYVVGFGENPPVQEIGGQVAIFDYTGYEQQGHTTIKFSIPQQAIDQLHYDLGPQQEIYLILAYSQEDDFNHHSLIRRHVKVTL